MASSSAPLPFAASLPWHGCATCTKPGCEKRAYYVSGGVARCGRHSDKVLRKNLKKKPDHMVKEERAAAYEEHLRVVKQVAHFNRKVKKTGKLQLFKIQGRFGMVTHQPGFHTIYPNKFGTKVGGSDMPSLSPMNLGPVHHGQAHLPPSLTVENFHQFSKRFPDETDDEFLVAQRKAFRDPVAHRHKLRGVKPLYTVWVDASGKEHRLSYVESRQLYCHFYARLAQEQAAFKDLKDRLATGENLLLAGYDAHSMGDGSAEAVEKAYLDPSKSFGHEACLFCMLTLPETAWPWKKHTTLVLP